MKTLVIYDNTGYIYMIMSNTYIIPKGGINYLEVEVPEGKYIKSIDTSTTPNKPVYEDIPKTELQLTQEQLLVTQAQLADLKEQILLKENGGI